MSKANEKKQTASAQPTLAALEEKIDKIGTAVFGSDNFNLIMNKAINTQGRVKRGFSKRMGKGLHFYNMPTQEDIVSLAEQCGRIEERMVRIEALLLTLTEDKPQPSSSAVPRTRKPKAKTNSKTASAKKPAAKSSKTESKSA